MIFIGVVAGSWLSVLSLASGVAAFTWMQSVPAQTLTTNKARPKTPPAATPKAATRPANISPAVRAALERISAASLRGHLSFIASDLLEGRSTPSRGLDLAGEYIAAQFRRAGLEPAGDDGYFQTTNWSIREPNVGQFTLPFNDTGRSLQVAHHEVSLSRAVMGQALTPELMPGVVKGLTLSQHSSGTLEKPPQVRNVIGLLRGSDPALKDTYVMLSAHYDHIGVARGVAGDTIYNGANDNGSGVVSVIEIATALKGLRPRRSILFVTFFGEEEGLIGSRYYGQHPVVPLEKTVAQINLEQLGRTDDSEGPQVGTLTMTGFDYSNVGEALKVAGKLTGVKFYKHPQNSDAYFSRSDNQALADVGVPAHTLGVAFDFPDYHGLGDHWDKIDYANLEKINRMVAVGLLSIANNPRAPKWNEANPKTEKYVKAWRARQKTPVNQ